MSNMPPMNPLLHQTRRHFFRQCGVGLGSMALGSLLGRDAAGAAPAAVANPLAPRAPHHAPKATSVIYLFMAGGPSQLELFDYKPRLQELNGQPIPQSFIEGRRFAFMDSFARQVPRESQAAVEPPPGLDGRELLQRLYRLFAQ